ncbi:MAG TPA: extracellular solute-binding protein [Thermoleophilaceae bacterium]|nr:extracellular solute-binding protein [Thermoleophilaceae bacterium]
MSRRALLATVIGGAVLLVAAFVGVVLATSGSSSDSLVLYSARSHYGEEKPFEDFAKKTGTDLTIRGGDASELYERLQSEGKNTPADVLITVDAANLWRAQHAGIIDSWKPLTYRARTIMRSTERVGPNDVTTYDGLGDPRWKGKLCLRSGTSEYNVSFVADRMAKDGRAATERMLRRWMANDPKIFGSDTDVLEAIKDGDCDVGLTNSYYLGRELADDPSFPVAPVWADQNGRGTHVNLSGLGVVHWSDKAKQARELIDYLRQPSQQEIFAENNHEYPAVAGVKPDPVMARFGTFKRDVIDVAAAGPLLDDALKLMDEVGWD